MGSFYSEYRNEREDRIYNSKKSGGGMIEFIFKVRYVQG